MKQIIKQLREYIKAFAADRSYKFSVSNAKDLLKQYETKAKQNNGKTAENNENNV